MLHPQVEAGQDEEDPWLLRSRHVIKPNYEYAIRITQHSGEKYNIFLTFILHVSAISHDHHQAVTKYKENELLVRGLPITNSNIINAKMFKKNCTYCSSIPVMPTVVKCYLEHRVPLTVGSYQHTGGWPYLHQCHNTPEDLNHQDDVIFTTCHHTKSTSRVEMIYKPKMLKPIAPLSWKLTVNASKYNTISTNHLIY